MIDGLYQQRTTPLGLLRRQAGQPGGFSHTAWHPRRMRKHVAKMTTLAKQMLGVGLLEIAAAALATGDMSSDGQNRDPAPIGVIKPIDQIKIAWPGASGAHQNGFEPPLKQMPLSRMSPVIALRKTAVQLPLDTPFSHSPALWFITQKQFPAARATWPQAAHKPPPSRRDQACP